MSENHSNFRDGQWRSPTNAHTLAHTYCHTWWHISGDVGQRSMAISVARVAETLCYSVGYRFGARLVVLFLTVFCHLSPELYCFHSFNSYTNILQHYT